jgi:hypothetical protein
MLEVMKEVRDEVKAMRVDLGSHMITFGRHEAEDNAAHEGMRRIAKALDGDGSKESPGIEKRLTALESEAITTGKLWTVVGICGGSWEAIHQLISYLASHH